MTTNVARRQFLIAAGALTFSSLSAGTAATEAKLKIGMIGAGKVGTALGSNWIRAGHRVMFSSRHPEEIKVGELGSSASVGSIAQAVEFGDVVVFAVPYSAFPAIAKEHGAALARKRAVVDSSNPFPDRDGEAGVKAIEKGVGLYLKELMPGVPLVRAFCFLPAAIMAKGGKREDGTIIGVPMLGDDAKAIAVVSELARDAEFDPVVIGPLSFGKYLQPPKSDFAGLLTADEIRERAAKLK